MTVGSVVTHCSLDPICVHMCATVLLMSDSGKYLSCKPSAIYLWPCGRVFSSHEVHSVLIVLLVFHYGLVLVHCMGPRIVSALPSIKSRGCHGTIPAWVSYTETFSEVYHLLKIIFSLVFPFWLRLPEY